MTVIVTDKACVEFFKKLNSAIQKIQNLVNVCF